MKLTSTMIKSLSSTKSATPAKRKVATPAKRKGSTANFKSTLKGLGMYQRSIEPPKVRIISDDTHDPHADDHHLVRIINFKVSSYPTMSCLLAVRTPNKQGETNARLVVTEHTIGINVSSSIATIGRNYDKHLLEVEVGFINRTETILDFLGSVLALSEEVRYGNIKLG